MTGQGLLISAWVSFAKGRDLCDHLAEETVKSSQGVSGNRGEVYIYVRPRLEEAGAVFLHLGNFTLICRTTS